MKVGHWVAEIGRLCQRVGCKMPLHKEGEMKVHYRVAETGIGVS